ncbi:hypothetical protein QZH41_009808, partial [Actinostola sp. cb2023]
IQDLLDNTTALGDLSHCLDRDFKHVKNWSHFAFVLGVPADVIRTCNLYLEHSPTRKLFEYLEVTRPHLIIEQLRDALIKNKEKPRFDVHDKIKEFGSNERVSEVITNSESDILDKIALNLDSATKSSSNWKDLGKELGVKCDKLKLFEMYNNYNPTVALLRYIYATSQEQEHISLGVIMEYLKQMKREDVLIEVRNVISSKGIQCVNAKAKDVFQLGSELLENTSQMLNRDTAGVDGWRVLARHLIYAHCIDDKDGNGIDIIKKLEPPQPQDIHSPTKEIIEWLAASRTETTIDSLVGALEKIRRNDAVGILFSHFSRASEGISSIGELAVKILTTCGLLAPSQKEKDKVKELFKNLDRNCVLILDNIDHMFHASEAINLSSTSSTISEDFPWKQSKETPRSHRKEDQIMAACKGKGIEITEKMLKRSHSKKDQIMVAMGYNDLAGAYSYLSDSYGTAIQIREKQVLPVYAEHLGIHVFAASALSHLSHDYSALQRYDEALKACNTALSYRRSLLGEHQETARSLSDMGHILSEQGICIDSCENPDKNFEEALKYHEEALIMRQHILDTPEETMQTHEEIACILRSLRREDEAREHENKIAELVKSIKKLDKPHLN